MAETRDIAAEVKDVIRFDDGGQSLAYTAGVMIPFGSVEKAAPVAAAPLTNLDSDADGVDDGVEVASGTDALDDPFRVDKRTIFFGKGYPGEHHVSQLRGLGHKDILNNKEIERFDTVLGIVVKTYDLYLLIRFFECKRK